MLLSTFLSPSLANGFSSTCLKTFGSNVWFGLPVMPSTSSSGNFSTNRAATSLPVPSPRLKSDSRTAKSSCASMALIASPTLPANTNWTLGFCLVKSRRSIFRTHSSSSTTSILLNETSSLVVIHIMP